MTDKDLTLWLKLKDDASKAFQGSAKVIAAAAVAIGVAVAAAGIKLFQLASTAEEADNVIGLAFGSMKQSAIDWSETFAAATGSSKFESRELAADLGLIIRGMGFTEAATLGMSTQMVELAADMSSAKNVPLAEALDKIRAGLIGESEPLRTMGVLLSEARVKSEAYASGLAATGSELTITQKVQARMNIILADSVAMHGDLINTQDSAANQWRAIKNVVFDAATTFGQKFMPVFIDVLGVMRTMVDRGVEVLEWMTETEDRMETLGAIMVGAVVAGIVAVTAGLWAMVPAITAATGGLNLVLPAIVVGIGLAAAAMWKFRDTLATVLVAAIDMYTGFVTEFLVQVHKIATLTDKVFGNDLAGLIANQASEIEQFRVDAGESLRGYATSVQGAADVTVEMADTLDVQLAPAAVETTKQVSLLESGVTALEDRLKAVIDTTRNTINALVGSQGLTNGFQQAAGGALLASAAIETGFITLPGKIQPAITNISTLGLTAATGWGAGFLDTLTTTITPDRITGIFTAAFTGGGGVLGALKAIGAELAGAFSQHFLTPFSSALSTGLSSIFGGGGAAAVAGAGGASAAGRRRWRGWRRGRCRWDRGGRRGAGRDTGLGVGRARRSGSVHVFQGMGWADQSRAGGARGLRWIPQGCSCHHGWNSGIY